MLPPSYEFPAALLLVLVGAVSCVAGYRLLKVVLPISGFILGAMIVSSMMGVTNTTGMVVAAILGGIAGAMILVFAHFVGIALIGAGLGALGLPALVTHFGWAWVRPGDPPAVAVIVLAICGAVGAMVLQRYVITVSTAFVGAWTMIVGTLAMVGDRAARAAAGGAVWILYPLTPAQGQRWVSVVWIGLGLIGTGVQLGITGRKRK